MLLLEWQSCLIHRIDDGLSRHGLNLLIAGPALWCLGSVHNICQVYERASGHVQLLHKGVQVPLLLGSTLFLVAGIVNRHDRRSRTTAFSLLVTYILAVLLSIRSLIPSFSMLASQTAGLTC
jgi:hypothetical protein